MKRKFLLFIILALSISSMTLAQERTVSGRVTSTEDGSALPGVNVVIKGTTNGTVTDSEGNYRISLPSSGGALVFSFIGLQTTEIAIGDRAVVDVSLALDVTQLSEVVVTALGIEVSKDKVGSASTNITGDAARKSGEANLINSLAGKSSGVNIARSTGDPGAGSYIQIRGQSSVFNSVQPLIVVDGVPVNNNQVGQGLSGVAQQSRLNDINPADIESYEVLKGASASALWGSRAAGGVIMITTKKGAAGKSKVNVSYSGTYSVDEINRKHPLQKTWGQGFSGAYYTNVLAGGPGNAFSFGDKIANRPGGTDVVIDNPLDPSYVGYFEAADGTRYYPIVESNFIDDANGGKNSREVYDVYDQLFEKGHFFDQTISVSGGDKASNFYISLGDLNQDGIYKGNSNYRRTSFRVNTRRQFSEIIGASSNFAYTRTTSDRIQQGSNINGLFLAGLRSSPDFDNTDYIGTYFNATGNAIPDRQRSYRNHIGRRADSNYDNPLWVANKDLDRSEVDRFIGSFQFDITPTDWITLTSRAGVDHYIDKRRTFFPVHSAGGGQVNGSLTLQAPNETQYNADFFAQANRTIGNDLSLTALLGVNFNERKFENVGATTTNFTIRTEPPNNLNNSTAANRTPFNSFSLIRTAAAYATLNLGYKDQLYFNATGRNESASTYGRSGDITYFYPSADVAWQFTKTLNMDSRLLSFGKLRVAYGEVSTQPSVYNTATYFNNSVYGDGWGTLLDASSYGGGIEQSSVLGNQFLKPETKAEIEFGGDFRFLEDRIKLGATYFSNEIRDILLPVQVAQSTGYTNKTANVGKMENKGIEIDLSGEVLKVGDFSWNIYGNWTRIRNLVTDLAGSGNFLLNGFTGSSSNAVEGYALGVIYGNGYQRNPEGQFVLDSDGFPQADINSRVLGDPNPDWRGGLGTNMSWKGLSFNVLFEHSHGGEMWGGTRGALFNFGTHADTDHEVTLTAAEAAVLKNYSGATIDTYGYIPNTDGSYTIRGYRKDFGGGEVIVDESWWTSLGGGFGSQAEDFIEKAQWTRLRELSLGYTLNSEGFRSKTKLTSIEISLTGRNLMLWTDFKGNDPETNLSGASNGRGLEYFNNPSTRSYLVSFKINY